MTATKQARDHTQLRYVSEHEGVVTFTAPSASDPSKVNTVSYDTETGAVGCDCRWCALHPGVVGGCWLSRSVVTAYYARFFSLCDTARLRLLDDGYNAARYLDADQLLRWELVRAELARRATPARRRT